MEGAPGEDIHRPVRTDSAGRLLPWSNLPTVPPDLLPRYLQALLSV